MLEHFPVVKSDRATNLQTTIKHFKNMKKPVNQQGYYRPLLKLNLKMKLTTLLLITTMLGLHANDSYSQKTKVTLDVNNASVSAIIDDIESATEFRFIYKVKHVDLERQVSLKVEGEKIETVLNVMFENTKTDYKVRGRQIILREGKVRRPTVKAVPTQSSKLPNQDLVIKGSVNDLTGTPLPGANILEKGTSNGTQTDFDGHFSIEVSDENAVLVVSYIGFTTQEVALQGRNQIVVELEESAAGLDEVVIVGYGTQKKSDVTGSIVSLKPDEFKDMNLGVTEVLQGRVAGVNVSNGSIIIRGAASINGSNPLWIVDGAAGVVPNMDDIESIEVLKDASSTAIYGAAGAGGVILVTTKKGRAGKLQVHFRQNIGMATPTYLPDYLSTPDYIKIRLASGFQPSETEMEISGWHNPASLPSTDWNDILFRSALQQNYYLNLSGGTEKTKLSSSLVYSNNRGIGVASPVQEQFKFRIASVTQFNDKLKITQILNANLNRSEGGSTGGLPYRVTPIMEPYDANNPDGGWGMRPVGNLTNAFNPLMSVMNTQNLSHSVGVNLNLILDYEVASGLMFQANFTGSGGGNGSKSYNPDASAGDLFIESKLVSSNGANYFGKMFYTLDYKKTLGDKHNIGALIGYDASKSVGNSTRAEATNFSIDPAWSIGLGADQQPSSGSRYDNGSFSQFARLNYSYDSKYMVQGTIRRDGYPQFGPDNRFGVFPSVSAGWNIHKESFIADNLSWISNLKLRSGYGAIGNSSVPNFLYLSSWTNTQSFYSPDGVNVVTPYRYDKLPNTSIKWEEVTQLDIGLEAGLFNNKLNFSAEYYDKNTTDMLYPITLPPSASQHMGTTWTQTPFIANIGEINNKGFDFMVQYQSKIKELNFDVALTASTNKNVVVKLSDELNPIIWRNGSSGYPMASSMYRTENGKPMGQMYGYQVAGIFQTQEEIDALNLAAGEGNFYQVEGTAPGDFKYVDLNNDNMITPEEDMDVIGNPWPKLIYGSNISLSWRNFELNMGWLGNYDTDIYNTQKINDHNIFQSDNATTKIFDYWSPSNTDSKNPRVVFGDPNQNFSTQSDYLIEDGSFLKLKTLYLGWGLPKPILDRLNLGELKFFVNFENLLIFSKFEGDPELGGGYLERNSFGPGRTPSTKSVMGGISLKL